LIKLVFHLLLIITRACLIDYVKIVLLLSRKFWKYLT